MKKISGFGLKKLTAIAAAATVIASGSYLSVFAADTKTSDWDFISKAISEENSDFNDKTNYVVKNPKVDKTTLPSKFDLRDVDGKCYVPEIRSQNPFGTCWSFGATAAAEISVAHEYDADFNTMSDPEKSLYDFSERLTAWFAYEPIHEDDHLYASQAGEGLYRVYSSDDLTEQEKAVERFNIGGEFFHVLPLYAAGVGPVWESTVPYENKEGAKGATILLVDIDENGKILNKEYLLDDVVMTYDEYLKKVEEVKKTAKNVYEGISGAGKYYGSIYCPSANGDWTVDYSKNM